MLSFSKKSHIDTDYINKLIDKTVVIEKELEKEFYKLYHETRLMLITELEHQHSQMSRDESVHYTQLILNRYIFICFAEDLNLLPEQTSFQTITFPITNHDLGRSEIWHKLNHLFIDINEGNEFKKIYGYNGGLFQENLEHLKIRDIIDDHTLFKDTYTKWKFEEYSSIVEEKLNIYTGKINPIYHNLLTISTFNFASDLDVNILGHIFENSIGDIEQLKKDTRGRRKKDGIYYTPEYITDYICRNTILSSLSKTGKANTIKTLIDEYQGRIDDLDHKVKEIKILDPACGSGAFLNKAADILLEIHQAIHKKKYKDKQDLSPFFDNISERREILLKNIYGVDLNTESVGITKLSLFLKVCRKDLKLPNLNNNIKTGNSLIDNPKYTDKPFDYNEEFKKVMDAGGFDIIIGNPPYITIGGKEDQGVSERVKEFLSAKYKSYKYKANYFILFTEKSINLLKNKCYLSFIVPRSLLENTYMMNLREIILDKTKVKVLLDLRYKVFDDAEIGGNLIFIIEKDINEDNDNNLVNYCILLDSDSELKELHYKNKLQSIFKESDNLQFLIFSGSIIDKIEENTKQLGDICYVNNGVNTGNAAKILLSKEKKSELYRKLLEGKDINRYSLNWNNLWINYDPSLKSTINLSELNTRQKKIDFSLRKEELFNSNKIILRQTADRLIGAYDENKFISRHSTHLLKKKMEIYQ